MRGHVLLLSRDACNGMTAGGFLKGWSSSNHFNEQQNGTIKGTDGNSTPLWTQDYYKDGGDEPLGDHFPLFAKFRLKN